MRTFILRGLPMRSFVSVIILILCLFTKLPADSVDNFAYGLKSIQPPKTEEKLLGPWMVTHRPQDLIAYDKNKHIYQIKVLKQWKGDCWVHSFRNILYFLDLLDSLSSRLWSMPEETLSFAFLFNSHSPERSFVFQVLDISSNIDSYPEN